MYMEDDTRVQVDFLVVIRLQLSIGIFLKLQDVAYIPSIRRNLISVFWINLDIILFLELVKLNCIEIHY